MPKLYEFCLHVIHIAKSLYYLVLLHSIKTIIIISRNAHKYNKVSSFKFNNKTLCSMKMKLHSVPILKLNQKYHYLNHSEKASFSIIRVINEKYSK